MANHQTMHHPNTKNDLNGFSLLELMACLTLVSVFAIAGTRFLMDSFQRILATVEMEANAQYFLQAIHLARSEAIRTQSYVSIRPICENNWNSGWEVFINPNLQFLHAPLASDVLLHHRLASVITTNNPAKDQQRRGNQFQDLNMKGQHRPCIKSLAIQGSKNLIKHISFTPAGGAVMKSGGFIANRLVFWHKNYPQIERQILMSASGRIRICNPQIDQSQCPN